MFFKTCVTPKTWMRIRQNVHLSLSKPTTSLLTDTSYKPTIKWKCQPPKFTHKPKSVKRPSPIIYVDDSTTVKTFWSRPHWILNSWKDHSSRIVGFFPIAYNYNLKFPLKSNNHTTTTDRIIVRKFIWNTIMLFFYHSYISKIVDTLTQVIQPSTLK